MTSPVCTPQAEPQASDQDGGAYADEEDEEASEEAGEDASEEALEAEAAGARPRRRYRAGAAVTCQVLGCCTRIRAGDPDVKRSNMRYRCVARLTAAPPPITQVPN